uniref:Uncharacterized protein n=1 Tax=Panagrolaimus sp. ES5 TaxID=591445 RepID=A0AC34GQS6_9BILA
MVCVPCIILPVLLGLYLRFIQPFILRYIPEGWKEKFDAYLYPTCPIKRQQPVTTTATTDKNETEIENIEPEEVKDTAETTATCCKKDD